MPGPQITDDVINETIKRVADTWQTCDASEAFFARRTPDWTVDGL
ncbi:MAG: hypothetical protein AAGD47_15325 [Pseudomonadota bacterium]